jgi:hypothetical protein
LVPREDRDERFAPPARHGREQHDVIRALVAVQVREHLVKVEVAEHHAAVGARRAA